jgi:hypothetical protein
MIENGNAVSERNSFEVIKKGPHGPDGFAIHLRITGLKLL